MSKSLLAIVRGERIANQSAGGRPSYHQMKGLMNYIAFGRHNAQLTFSGRAGLDQAAQRRGFWYDHNGKPASHETALRWAREKVHRYGYEHAYQLLLSTRYGGLTERDFNRVLQQGSGISCVYEWRYMVHEDTGNQHAHVILLRREKLTNALYKEWQQTMQAELERLQVERYQERQLQQERQAEQEQALLTEPGPVTETPDGDEKMSRQGWEMEI
jgi:hypothetical protein